MRYIILSTLIFFSSCRSIEKKIIGTWYSIESTGDLISNDSLLKLISRYPEMLKNYKSLSFTTYYADKTFHRSHDDYKENGTYEIKGDTLITKSFETNFQIISRIDKNIHVTSLVQPSNRDYWYMAKETILKKLIRKKYGYSISANQTSVGGELKWFVDVKKTKK